MAPVHVVGIGGSTRPDSTTEQVVGAVLRALAARGATVTQVAGPDLLLPHYDPAVPVPPAAGPLIDTVRRADAVVLGSPGYHGTLSGLVKNAVDYLEECRDDPRPYLDGVPVGCIATAAGWQAAVTTLGSLRHVVHALRGWPTPLGIAVNTAEAAPVVEGRVVDPRLAESIEIMADQLLAFSRGR